MCEHSECASQTKRCRIKSKPFPSPASTHWDEITLRIFAATVNSGHTLVPIKHKARVTEAAFLASGGDSGVSALTVTLWIQARRWTGRKAVRVVAVGWTLQIYGVEGESGSFTEHALTANPRVSKKRGGAPTSQC